MQEINRPMLVVWAAAALAVALIGARYLKSVGTETGPATAPAAEIVGRPLWNGRRTGAGLVVHVAGAVRRPGLVRVEDGRRVGDAIRAAGGPGDRADMNAINLAMKVADGQQIVVPSRVAVPVGSGARAASGPVSLSSATVDQLDQLDGIGPGLAEKIVQYRTEHGGFRSVEELGEVPGIGDKRLESLRGQLQP